MDIVEVEDGKTLENMLPTDLTFSENNSARKSFKDARTRKSIKDGSIARKKVAVMVINNDYSESELTDLPEGPLADLKIAEKVFQSKATLPIYIMHWNKDKSGIYRIERICILATLFLATYETTLLEPIQF